MRRVYRCADEVRVPFMQSYPQVHGPVPVGWENTGSVHETVRLQQQWRQAEAVDMQEVHFQVQMQLFAVKVDRPLVAMRDVMNVVHKLTNVS